MNMKHCILLLFMVSSALLIAPEQKYQESDEINYSWSRTLAEILQLINKKHYQASKLEEAWMKALDAFLSNLDPHSGLLTPLVYKEMMERTSGEFFGIGIVIDNTRKAKDRQLTVVDTIPAGPADKAGVKPLDKIIEIDGVSLAGMSTEQATMKLKGPRNTKVTIKVLREDKPDLLSFTITRDVVQEQNSLSFYIKDQNIYYLMLSMFSENAVRQVEQLLQESTKHKYKGLILDLRNNSGGLLEAVISICGMFINKGSTVVITKSKGDTTGQKYVTNRQPIVTDCLPIFILINNYTASAAEILAGVLKIHSEQQPASDKNKLMVFLVGTKTFGKGSVQEVIPVSNNCAIKLTTSLYYLPNNTTIQGIGIEPDFVIEKTLPLTEQMRWFATNYGHEESFENHIKVTETAQSEKDKNTNEAEKTNENKRWIDRAKEMLQSDNQLRSTIMLINLLHTAQTACPDRICTREKALEFIKQHHVTHEKLMIEPVQL
jgi:carboxyl-terminal processing protease